MHCPTILSGEEKGQDPSPENITDAHRFRFSVPIMSIVGYVRVLGFGLFVAKETVLIMLEEQRALAKGTGNEEKKITINYIQDQTCSFLI